jgi:hypothetical protein
MIVNAPLRNNVDISTWGLSKVNTICNGGTWTRDPLNFATDAQLQALAASGKDVIYSVCLARTPEQELAEVNRYLSFGVSIVAVRLGNEENQYVDMTGIWIPAAYAYGEAQGAQYVTNVQPYADILPFPRIYSGEFPSNMQGTRFELFREGWNKGISDNINAEDKIDMHIYQNQDKLINQSQQIDLSYLKLTPHPVSNKFVIIESGIPIQTVVDENSFVSQTISLWERIIEALRPEDEFGVQLMEQAEFPIGMVYNGKLTELGEWVNGLFYEEEPKVVVTRIPYTFVSWFSGLYLYGLYDLSDGRKKVFARFFKSEAPSVGDEWPG